MNDGVDDKAGPRPSVPYWHLHVDDNGVSHQTRCALTNYEFKGVGPADPQWNDKMERGEATVVFTVQPVGWVGDWHENPAPQWIVLLPDDRATACRSEACAMSPEVTLAAITGFRLVTAAPDRLAAFYRAIGFEVGDATAIPTEEMAVLQLRGGGVRRTMTLGPSRVDLDVFDSRGRDYPSDTSACDQVFQHLALVTDDATAAWRRASEAGATSISRTDPIRLPNSAGGVTAIKFRDPEGHPLEFLQFPVGAKADWFRRGHHGN
jgi:catechol 2,3-dioxygenase-like lactoylglutathione lyase family enzyme